MHLINHRRVTKVKAPPSTSTEQAGTYLVIPFVLQTPIKRHQSRTLKAHEGKVIAVIWH